MLKLSLAVGDTIFIGRGIRVTVVGVERRGRAQLAIGAPDDVAVSRGGRGFDYHLARQLAREVGSSRAGNDPVGDGA